MDGVGEILILDACNIDIDMDRYLAVVVCAIRVFGGLALSRCRWKGTQQV